MDIKALEEWYQAHQRNLPFRATSDPYPIWVSEIMAQQTKMETVIPYFLRYMETYPTIQSLAEANEENLHKLFEGIGYYRRFQYMQKAAQKIVHELGGVFPSTYEGVKSLPGIGDYTAGAIMSIAFNKPYAATDGNVIRVLSRYYGIDDDMKDEKARKKIDALNQQLITDGTPQIYTQAMMELGALVCKPSNPQCESCPLRDDCYAYINKKTEALPVLSRKTSTRIRSFTTLILIHQDRTALIKNDEGLLKGMYLYPQFENKAIEELTNKLSEEGYQIDAVKYLKKYQHIFTHQRWVMEAYVVQVKEITTDNKYTWTDDVLSLPMAIAHRKIRINS